MTKNSYIKHVRCNKKYTHKISRLKFYDSLKRSWSMQSYELWHTHICMYIFIYIYIRYFLICNPIVRLNILRYRGPNSVWFPLLMLITCRKTHQRKNYVKTPSHYQDNIKCANWPWSCCLISRHMISRALLGKIFVVTYSFQISSNPWSTNYWWLAC